MKFFLGSFFVVAVATAYAGPFGLEMGMKPDDPALGHLDLVKGTTYKTAIVPKPHQEFSSYYLTFSPESGLAKVTAMTPIIKTNAFGDEVKLKFAALEKSLTSIYGKPEKCDFTKTGSIWSRPQDWSMALLKNEASLFALWSKKFGFTGKYGVSTLLLEAEGISASSSVLLLDYEFENFGDLLQENSRKEQDAL